MAGKGEEGDQCLLVLSQLLVVRRSHLNDRRRSAERRATPAGRGSIRLDLTPASRDCKVTAEGKHIQQLTYSPCNAR